MEKEQLIELLKNNSLRKISEKFKISRRSLENFIKANNVLIKYNKAVYDTDFFNIINTKEKAYILGFLLGDSCLTKDRLELTVAIEDKNILDYISNNIGGNIRTDLSFNKTKKRFPRARIMFENKNFLDRLHTLFGGLKKEDRHIPIISKNLELYMLLGFFDAEGCITWGKRKDRNKIWHKISFTSSYSMLVGIQNILLKHNISTALRPKKDENCFVLETTNKQNILNAYNILYSDLIVLKRKYNNFDALRLELGEFGESSIIETIPSQANSTLLEGVETTGEV